ncbi:anthocyanidin 5,3-O-glucosyltransferase [Iris pallida]|uniref:Anthocyanidin 5,3-O-glucosyltransferase n=1 Tax=Iris pallida TaxID=29817 RepID=A0AAX6F737_IRIPA|nr:anthocyanidin 5,3-O-glucosyltransferase [Iris pallida]
MDLKQSVVLFPTVGMGHLIPMVELAKLFDAHGFSVTVVVVDPPFDTSSSIDPFLPRVSAANPSILFHRLPKIPSSKDTTFYHFDTLRMASAMLLDFLKASERTLNVRALVLDMFCMAGLDVADELGVPSYFFFPSGAITLAAFLSLPALQSELEEGSFRDLGDGAKVRLPGLPPVSVSDLPDDIPDRDDTNRELMSHLERLWRADGYIVNSFEWLEKRAVRALADGGSCVPGPRNPPVYCIGPLNANAREGASQGVWWWWREARVSRVAGCSAREERGVPVLWQHRPALSGAAQGDRHRAGAERAKVPLGCAQPGQ